MSVLAAVSTVVNRMNERSQIEFLVMKRADNGLWNFPGGKVEPPENLEQAAARELMEESGIDAHSTNVVQIFSNGTDDGTTFIFVLFYADVNKDVEVTLNKEHTEYRWVTMEQFEEEIVPEGMPRLMAMANSERLHTSGCWHRDVTEYPWYEGERSQVGKAITGSVET